MGDRNVGETIREVSKVAGVVLLYIGVLVLCFLASTIVGYIGLWWIKI